MKTTVDGHFSEQPKQEWANNIRGLHTFFVCGQVFHDAQPALFLNRPKGNIIVRKRGHDTQQADHVTNYEMGQIMGGN